MPNITEEQIFEAIETVSAPGEDKSLSKSGLISGLTIRDGLVHLSITAQTNNVREMETCRLECEQILKDLPNVKNATVVLTAERTSKGTGENNSDTSNPQGQVVPNVYSLIAVASGNGGVGKSTTSVNLALALAQEGKSVGLMDADIYGPSLPRMMGITDKPQQTQHKKLLPPENYGIRCMSMGMLVAEEEPMIWRGPMVMSALQQMLSEVEWGSLDILVIDLPPGTGDAQLTLAQQTKLTGAVIVSTPQDIALLDARKGLNMFRKVSVPIIGIVENMSYFICPNCGQTSHIFDHDGARKTAEENGVEFLGGIPLDIEIRQTSDKGIPIMVQNPESKVASEYRQIAKKVISGIENVASKQSPEIIIE